MADVDEQRQQTHQADLTRRGYTFLPVPMTHMPRVHLVFWVYGGYCM